MLLNCVLRFVHKHTKFTYGHLDDVLIAHRDQQTLQVLVDVLRAKLKHAGWVLNTSKSILKPVKELKFLGAKWDSFGIIRDNKVTKFVTSISQNLLNSDPKGKTLMRVRGYLNYYLGFAGKDYPVINTFLKMTQVTRREYWWYIDILLKCTRLRFRNIYREKSRTLVH